MTVVSLDYVEHGHPGVWPDGELPAMRTMYDRLLAEQSSEPRSSSGAAEAKR